MNEQKKSHRPSQAGRKHSKKKSTKKKNEISKKQARSNPKAFSMFRGNRANRTAQRSHDLLERKLHVPLIQRDQIHEELMKEITKMKHQEKLKEKQIDSSSSVAQNQTKADLSEEQLSKLDIPDSPPLIVAIVGPPKSGKSTIIKSLFRYYTKQNLSIEHIAGPLTVVTGKKRRLTFFECPNDINAMLDIGKVADILLLTIDASYGFEMETFEFLNILQAHGFPKIMGVLTHLDTFTSKEKLKDTKKQLKHRFWTEVYQGAKLFYFSGLLHGRYLPETMNLARFLSVMKPRPLVYRNTHGYMLADRVEDLTDPEQIRLHPEADREVALYGYVRGMGLRHIQGSCVVHIAGLGDIQVKDLTPLSDPCPLPESSLEKRRRLHEKHKLMYAPMMPNLSGLLYDKDAVYIDVPENNDDMAGLGEGDLLLEELKQMEETMNKDLDSKRLTLFSDKAKIKNQMVIPEEESDEDSISEQENTVKAISENEEEELNDEEHIFSDLSDNEELDDDEDAFKVAEQWRAKFLDNEKSSSAFMSLSKTQPQWMDLVYQENSASQIEANSKHLQADALFTIRAKPAARMKENILGFTVPSGVFDDEHLSPIHKDNSVFQDLEALKRYFITGATTESEEELPEGDEEEDMDDAAQEDPQVATEEKWKRKFNQIYQDEVVVDGEQTYFDQVKEQQRKQLLQNEIALQSLSPETRQKLEGVSAGHYCRLVVTVSPEFIEYFNPKFPILIGGLAAAETSFGFIHVRIKKHRWFPRLLKSNEPLIISMGWRRFQTLPLYYVSDANGVRHRLLKYTPKHMHCYAVFYGPLSPQNTGLVAFKSITAETSYFRIAASGVTLESDQSVPLVKKLKLTGMPFRIHKNTAFIKNMFSSPLEVAKFHGASLRTVSGIRGQIKKALKLPAGAFRATFEDKLLLSDIVFLRAWYPVEPRAFYNPVTSLLLQDKQNWQGMRLNYQVRMEKNISLEQNRNIDSVKKEISERPIKRQFNPLKIPTALEKALPFSSKPKQYSVKRKTPYLAARTAVIQDKKDKKLETLLQQVSTLHHHQQKIKKQKVLEHKQKIAKMLAKEEKSKN